MKALWTLVGEDCGEVVLAISINDVLGIGNLFRDDLTGEWVCENDEGDHIFNVRSYIPVRFLIASSKMKPAESALYRPARFMRPTIGSSKGSDTRSLADGW